MDKPAQKSLVEGATKLGISLDDSAVGQLLTFASELLRWNKKVNLTGASTEQEVLEKHVLDSLALIPHLGSRRKLLDVGSGAGLPGLVVKIARPDLLLTSVDSIGKKVAFQKHIAALLRLTHVDARQVRASGDPERDGISRAEVVVSRAVIEPKKWLAFARPYLSPGGVLITMLARPLSDVELSDADLAAPTFRQVSYRLPGEVERSLLLVGG